MAGEPKERWAYRWQPRPAARLRLFCFPYAGGAAYVFRSWSEKMPAAVEVCAIQLPGRGARLAEKPYSRMRPLVSALADGLAPLLDMPFAFFGHSMGAWTAFELARRLRQKLGEEPRRLCVSGAGAPHLPQREGPLHALPEPEFVESLRHLNGTPKEVLENPELMSLISPTLRADFEVCETYAYVNGRPLTCPLSAFAGLQDRRLKRSDVAAWRAETAGPFEVRLFPGAHFFIHTSEGALVAHLAEELERATGPRC